MIENYSIEQEAEKIYIPQTLEYFRESYSCYKQGNFRAATVTLWSVLICDLVYKLQELVDTYQDTKAQAIIEKIKNQQKSSPYSSKWEVDLIDDIHKETALIDIVELNNLKFIQSQRNLSAHPNIGPNNTLNSPNKDTTRAVLRMALEAVLTKPAFYTDKIIGNIFRDLTENEFAYIKNTKEETLKSLRIILEKKYLNNLRPNYELSLFRNFWRITFKSNDAPAKKNRSYGLYFLEIVCQRAKFNVTEEIKKDEKYYNQISEGKDVLPYLSYLICHNPGIYQSLSEQNKLALQSLYEAQSDPAMVITGWYLAPSADEHLNKLEEWLNSDPSRELEAKQYLAVARIFDSEEWKSKVFMIASKRYSKSGSYDTADKRFSFISKLLPNYSKSDIKDLLSMINKNDQCYLRRSAKEDHLKILEACNRTGISIPDEISNLSENFLHHLNSLKPLN